MHPLNWIDDYTDTPNLTIYTNDELQIPGLEMIGRHNRKEATFSLDNHLHEDAFEFAYVVSGQVIFSVDEVEYRVNGGEVFLAKPNEIHSTNAEPVSISEMYWFRITATMTENFLFLNRQATKELLENIHHITARKIPVQNAECISFIQNAMNLGIHPETRLVASQYIGLFLGKIIENANNTSFMLTPDIGRSISYIFEHIEDNLDLDELAAISILSTSQFKQKFKQQVGTPPRQFINYHKVEVAKALLKEGLSVTAITERLHFENNSYFTVVFKKFNHCTPTAYAKDHRKMGQR